MKTVTSSLFVFCLFCSNTFAQLNWVPFEGQIPENAIEGGFENGASTYICLANIAGISYPGTLSENVCIIALNDQIETVNDFDVLVQSGNSNLDWVQTDAAKVPNFAFVAGQGNNIPFYIGRMDYDEGQTRIIGKITVTSEALELRIPHSSQVEYWSNGFYILTEVIDHSGLDPETSDSEMSQEAGGGSFGFMEILLLAVVGVGVYFLIKKRKKGSAVQPHPTLQTTNQSKILKGIVTVNDRDQIKMLVNEGEMDDALNKMLLLLKEKSSDVYNEIISFNARLKDVEKQLRNDIISIEDANKEKNKIRSAILDLLDELTE